MGTQWVRNEGYELADGYQARASDGLHVIPLSPPQQCWLRFHDGVTGPYPVVAIATAYRELSWNCDVIRHIFRHTETKKEFSRHRINDIGPENDPEAAAEMSSVLFLVLADDVGDWDEPPWIKQEHVFFSEAAARAKSHGGNNGVPEES